MYLSSLARVLEIKWRVLVYPLWLLLDLHMRINELKF